MEKTEKYYRNYPENENSFKIKIIEFELNTVDVLLNNTWNCGV